MSSSNADGPQSLRSESADMTNNKDAHEKVQSRGEEKAKTDPVHCKVTGQRKPQRTVSRNFCLQLEEKPFTNL